MAITSQLQGDVQDLEQVLTVTLPPWRVILCNDDVHGFGEVIAALLRSVPLSCMQALDITMRAHTTGQADVIVCPREIAEVYQEKLLRYDLDVKIEKA